MNGDRTLTIDVSELPVGTADSRALLWWGNLGMMVIEGTMFMMLIATYIYFQNANLDWPPTVVPNPDLRSSVTGFVMLLLSVLPMLLVDRAALRKALTPIRIGIAICILVGIAFLSLQAFAVSTLGFKWSTHAYGSVIWSMIGVHTFHMIAATGESTLLFVYSFIRPITKKQLLDFRAVAVYWYFVVLMWIPLFFIIYVMPYYARK